MEKVQAKLSNWKAKLISPVGRVVLIQYVTSSIPAYYMQNVALPSRICSDLDNSIRTSFGVPLSIGRKFTWLDRIKFVDRKL